MNDPFYTYGSPDLCAWQVEKLGGGQGIFWFQMSAGLNSWERQFIQGLAKQGNKLSPKQQAVFDRICLTYLQEGSAP